MAYLKIPNLYKSDRILAFKSIFALEKVHGTSAHVRYKKYHSERAESAPEDAAHPVPVPGTVDGITFFSGGAKHEDFVKLFGTIEHVSDMLSDEKLPILGKFREVFAADPEVDVTVYGEAYGGKMQGMRDTYGPDLQFIAFEVKINGHWLAVPQATAVVQSLGLEFVPWKMIEADRVMIDAERDAESLVAIRRGMGRDKKREGVVLRPPFEVTLNDGSRVIAKHKAVEFSEIKDVKVPKPEEAEAQAYATAIVDKYCTDMRFIHVYGKFGLEKPPIVEYTGEFIRAFTDDLVVECGDEITWTREVKRAVGAWAAAAYKKQVTS